MFVTRFITSFDRFATPLSFTYRGDTEYKTFGGGLVSILLGFLTLSFLCMRLMILFKYEDLKISSYTILEDRGEMTKAINLGDYNARFVFGFFNIEF